jgi:hypothetical protein
LAPDCRRYCRIEVLLGRSFCGSGTEATAITGATLATIMTFVTIPESGAIQYERGLSGHRAAAVSDANSATTQLAIAILIRVRENPPQLKKVGGRDVEMRSARQRCVWPVFQCGEFVSVAG